MTHRVIIDIGTVSMKILNTKQSKAFVPSLRFIKLIVLGVFCGSLLCGPNTFARVGLLESEQVTEEKKIPESRFLNIPDELISEIMKHLDAPAYFKLSETNTIFRRIGSDKVLLKNLKERDPIGWMLHWPISGKIATLLGDLKKFEPTLTNYGRLDGLPVYEIKVETGPLLGFVIFKLVQNKGIGSSLSSIYGQETAMSGSLLSQKAGFQGLSNSLNAYVEIVDQVISKELPHYLSQMIFGWEQSQTPDHSESSLSSLCKVVSEDDVFPFFKYALKQFRPQFSELQLLELTKEEVYSRRPGVYKLCLSGDITAIRLLFALLEREL
ncbi:MAG: F-box protein [Bdellovibrionia bacterium]